MQDLALCPLSARRRRWRNLPKAVIEVAWVYAISLACCGKVSSFPNDVNFERRL